MSFARLRADILAARDAREAVLATVLDEAALDEAAAADAGASVIFVSLAIPGPDKEPAGSDALFRWALAELAGRLGSSRVLAQHRDVLGPFAILSAAVPAMAAKHVCIAIEDSRPPARLLDLDVYGTGGERLGRVETGSRPRACLLCDQPAADCMRLKRHSLEMLVNHAHHLLAAFGRTATG